MRTLAAGMPADEFMEKQLDRSTMEYSMMQLMAEREQVAKKCQNMEMCHDLMTKERAQIIADREALRIERDSLLQQIQQQADTIRR